MVYLVCAPMLRDDLQGPLGAIARISKSHFYHLRFGFFLLHPYKDDAGLREMLRRYAEYENKQRQTSHASSARTTKDPVWWSVARATASLVTLEPCWFIPWFAPANFRSL
jgi:hypothetical protein